MCKGAISFTSIIPRARPYSVGTCPREKGTSMFMACPVICLKRPWSSKPVGDMGERPKSRRQAVHTYFRPPWAKCHWNTNICSCAGSLFYAGTEILYLGCEWAVSRRRSYSYARSLTRIRRPSPCTLVFVFVFWYLVGVRYHNLRGPITYVFLIDSGIQVLMAAVFMRTPLQPAREETNQLGSLVTTSHEHRRAHNPSLEKEIDCFA